MSKIKLLSIILKARGMSKVLSSFLVFFLISAFLHDLFNLDKLSQEELKELSARIKKTHDA